ncbi:MULTISPECIES: glycosyltransferase [unclassified Mycobacterium]|uniref:glycosyltransferase n=1 Tax=unclassified Mycobacterium TaxID=2642494 RepID=UPI0007FD7378|nr:MULTISPECIES: glycosyltransferase [unclassified Mycobacterium]OBG72409.1 glycosyl transferase [Mycobacterium sp. E1214]OBH22540.1 glycosyl transferase [Mycobacterium sp. E1319]
MRVLLSTYDSRGGVEPLAGLALQLQARGVEVLVCAPPDEEFATLLGDVGVPLAPFGEPLRAMKTGPLPSEEDLRRHLDGLIAVQFDTVATAAAGCDALVSTGFPPVSAAVRSVAEAIGADYVYASYQPTILPSPHFPPPAYANGAFPVGLIDHRVLWQVDAQSMQTLFGAVLNGHRAAIGLPPVDNVRDYGITGRPWLAVDPTLGPWQRPSDIEVVQTGAWLLPDRRPLAPDLTAFLDAGEAPVYVGFGSMPMRASRDVAQVAIEAVRAQGRRVVLAQGWADLAPVDDSDDCFAVGEVNQQALFARVAAVVHHGGAGTTTTAARAGAPQVLIPQGADQPYWAGRVTRLGIGAAHDGPIPSVESLSVPLRAVLTPEARARARAVASAVRSDGAALAAALLVDEVTRRKSASTDTADPRSNPPSEAAPSRRRPS